MNKNNRYVDFNKNQQKILTEIKQALVMESSDQDSHRLLPIPFFGHRKPKSVYLYGPVGRGKTTLIQAIYDDFPELKRKIHFDNLCTEAHYALDQMDIPNYVRTHYEHIKLLWIDELQITDIASAMMLKRLIPVMLKNNIILIMTGNTEPINFYKGGLNREQFEPFIPYFYEHFICLPLNGDIDYRRLGKHRTHNQHFWLTPLPSKPQSTPRPIEVAFRKIASNAPEAFTLDLNMRTWQLPMTLKNAALLDFESLAMKNRSADDYNRLIQQFPTIYIINVPIFTRQNRDACRRFMTCIDILYDANGTLFMESAADPTQLYQDPSHFLPFERTESRLIELLHINANQ